jgi:two-component sensor histidine kinase
VELIRVFDSSPMAPARARTATGVLADRLPAEVYRDLQLVVTELTTNSVKFGGSFIRLWLSITPDGEVRGEVADNGPGGAAIDDDIPPETGGLGLRIVDALCSAWCNPAGTGRVWFILEGTA